MPIHGLAQLGEALVAVTSAPEISAKCDLGAIAAVAAAAIVNLAWIGFLGYGLFKLVGPAFS